MTNTTTTERTPEQIMRSLDMARAMEDRPAVERLTAELKNTIHAIFNPTPEQKAAQAAQDPERARRIARIEDSEAAALEAAHVKAIAEDTSRETVAVELAHREALEAEHLAALAENEHREFVADTLSGMQS